MKSAKEKTNSFDMIEEVRRRERLDEIEEERQEQAQKEAGLDHYEEGALPIRFRRHPAMQPSRSRIGK